MVAHHDAEEREANSGESDSSPYNLVLTPLQSSRSTTDPDVKLFVEDAGFYKSELLYKPSEYFYRGKQFDDEDLDAHDQEERRILQDPVKARKDRRRRSCIACCFSIWYLIFILILVGAIVAVKLAPKDPSVTFGGLNATEFIYKESENGSAQIEATLSCLLNVTNRNSRDSVVYDTIDLHVFFKGDSLGQFSASPAPSFEQKKHTTTTIVETMPKTVTTITDQANADSLTTEVSNSNVQLDVTGSVKGRSKVLGIKIKKFDIAVMCTLNVRPGDGASIAADVLSVSCYFSN